LNDNPGQVVRRYYEGVFGQRNLGVLDEVIAPDFVGHSAGYGDFTIADMRRDLAREFADMPHDETIVVDQLVTGNRVVTRWRYRWQHAVSLFGERPTGEWLEMEGVHIDRVAAGKIAERWEIKDLWGVVRRLGGTVTIADDREPAPVQEGGQ
jgi:predicted ester cyclase